nr:Ig-like domain-containing protein [Rhizobium cauense]
MSITVTPVDDAPILVDDHASGNEDTTITGNVLPNDSDPDGDTLFVTGFTVNGGPTPYLPGQTATIVGVGAITIEANGSFTFIPEPNYDGPVPNIVYTASDGKGGSGRANLIITINPVDDFVPTPDDNVPDFPAGPDFALNAIDADGAVLDAVDQIRGLNGIAEFAERPIEVPLRLTLTPFLGGSSTIVVEDPDGGSERVHVETIKRAGIVYLQIVDEPGGRRMVPGQRSGTARSGR